MDAYRTPAPGPPPQSGPGRRWTLAPFAVRNLPTLVGVGAIMAVANLSMGQIMNAVGDLIGITLMSAVILAFTLRRRPVP